MAKSGKLQFFGHMYFLCSSGGDELYIPLFRCERYDQPHLGDKNYDEYSYERWTWQELGGGHEAKDGALRGKSAVDYLALAAAIVTRELKEESYDAVKGFENFIQDAITSASSSARDCITILYTTQKEKVVVRQLRWSDLRFASEPRGVCFVVRVGHQFCRDLVREWRLRHARVMTSDALADESDKAEAVAAVAKHEDAFTPCTVPQLHLPSGRFHPTVELKQLEHSDVCLFPLRGFRPQSIDRRTLSMQQCAALYPHPDSLIFPSGHPMCRDCTRQYCAWIVANVAELPAVPAAQLQVGGGEQAIAPRSSSSSSSSSSSNNNISSSSSSSSNAAAAESSPSLGPRSRAEIPPEFLLAPPAAKPRGYGYGGYL